MNLNSKRIISILIVFILIFLSINTNAYAGNEVKNDSISEKMNNSFYNDCDTTGCGYAVIGAKQGNPEQGQKVNIISLEGSENEDVKTSVPYIINSLYGDGADGMDNEDISEHIGTGDGSSSDGSDETGTSDGNDAIYKHSGICGDITWTINQEGTLCLSGSGDFEYQNVGIFIYDKEGHEFFSRYIEAPWLEYATEIIHAKVNVQGVSSLQGIFSGGYMLSPDFEWIDTNICTNLVTVDFSGSDLSNVTSSFIAFQGCTALKSVNMEGLSMPGWIYAAATFDACEAVEEIRLPQKDVVNIYNARGIFSYNSMLNTLTGFECWNLSDTADVSSIFNHCDSLKEVHLPEGFGSAKDCEVSDVFRACYSLEKIILPTETTVYADIQLPIYEGSFYEMMSDGTSGDISYSSITPDMKNMTLIKDAKKEDDSYITLYFDACGGTSSFSQKRVAKGDTYGTLPTAEKYGYLFEGWYTSQSGGDRITEDDVVNNFQDEAMITLYAQWSENPDIERYTIYFDGNGGEVSFSEKVVLEGCEYGSFPTVLRGNYVFDGWYTEPDGGIKVSEEDIVTDSITLYAHWCTEEISEEDCLDRFYVSGYENTVDYCGTAITFPNIQVKYKGRVLTYGTDYTVKYSNNIRAAKATDEKAPTILILGKGVLKGKKETVKFTINPLDMENAVLSDVAVKENGKVQWKTTTITYNVNNKLVTLKKNRDFTYQYNDQSTGAYTVPGTYSVSVVGKGNYTGTTGFQEIIIDKKSQEQKLVSKLKISGFRSKVKYADGPICQDSIVVKDGTTPLTEGVDYTISYYDNEECGTAQMIIEGTGIKYVGSKVLKYKIVGTSISHATVEGIEKSYIYTGKAYVPEPSVYVKGVKLEAGTDYEFSYTNNVNAGKATVIISGKGKYSGTLKKYFRITAYNILEKDEVKLISVSPIEDVKYAAITKSGARPEVSVIYDGKVLVNGIDYTLKYTNNKKIASAQEPKKAPTVTIKGRGNFKGSLKKTFSIVE